MKTIIASLVAIVAFVSLIIVATNYEKSEHYEGNEIATEFWKFNKSFEIDITEDSVFVQIGGVNRFSGYIDERGEADGIHSSGEEIIYAYNIEDDQLVLYIKDNSIESWHNDVYSMFILNN